jgi:hypothetical protein
MTTISRHPVLETIAQADEIPTEAINDAMRLASELAPEWLAAIAHAIDVEILTQQDINLAYYGMHVLGAAREKGLWPQLVCLLRGPEQRIEELLALDYIETLPQIVAGAFDGDTETLFDLICDVRLPDIMRMALFENVGFLTWKGQIEPDTTRAFVLHYNASRLIPEGDIGWNGWEIAIEKLGWQEFAPLVEAAYADGRLETGMSELRIFHEGLAAAQTAAPDDDARFRDQKCAYIDDVMDAINPGAPILGELDDDILDDVEDMTEEELARWAAPPQEQRINPLRHVGRNDPCPCGSGKKYKKCCLAA